MNHKGQTLVAFVIIVPVLILLLAFVVDTGYLLKEKTKLNGVTKTIIRTTYSDRYESNYKDKVVDLFSKNDIPFDNVGVTILDDDLKISNNYEIDSIFGKIIGLKTYKIKLTLSSKEINKE